MHSKLKTAVAVTIAALLAAAAPGSAFSQAAKASDKDKEKKGEVTTLKLSVSKDGRSLVDQNGKVVANFVKGTRVKPAASMVQSNTQSMKGCMRCYPVCVIYEGSRCVSWARTCDWDFDC